ncbi:protein CbbY [Marmoricola endophyticus]|uniref:Protein CbbY n=1 Tax=Marmoricola endophyticus TaxID=2040280 RepID=A0A917BLB1_9ACTN|nr:HAD-IA family hydrolase [Marmoricola endophyticus]GGF50618.1 protein CbbY [Marmoricola endophyticus]
MTALLLGSISAVADTSELQRQAFNRAFTEHGLDWRWDREEYRSLLGTNGGRDRVAAYAAERGEDVDAEAVHATKSRLFRESLADGVEPRAGVMETVAAAREKGVKVALVTTTSPENVAALLDALPELSADDLDLVVDATHVEVPKPDPAVYAYAMKRLGELPEDCVAVEDNPGGLTAATVAGVRCIAFPNANTAALEFPGAERTVDHLTADLVA